MARHARYDRDTALGKAVDLFWEKGYQGSSMKQIEQALDMRPGSIYATFGSKDKLFSEALAAYAARTGRDMAEHMSRYDSVVDGLQDYLRKLARSYGSGCKTPSRACMVVKTLLESSNTHPEIRAQAQNILKTVEASLASLLEQARARGELPESTDCARLARLIQAQIVGLRSMAERLSDSRAMDQLGDDMAAILEPYRARH